jgi:hypothetical protein
MMALDLKVNIILNTIESPKGAYHILSFMKTAPLKAEGFSRYSGLAAPPARAMEQSNSTLCIVIVSKLY